MSDAVQNVRDAQTRGADARPAVGGFPYLAEALRQAGVRSNRFTVAAGNSLFCTDRGDVVQQTTPLVAGIEPVPAWDEYAVIAAVRADQAGQSTFPDFVRACWTAGVVHFDVDFAERTCTYVGARPEQHYVEHYPAVALADSASTT